MKVLKYKKEQFNTDDANQVCLDLEAELGISLMNKDPKNPNEVQGYISTSSDGDIEVCLYEQKDIDAIDARPEMYIEDVEVEKDGKKVKEKRTYKIKENVPRKKCSLTDEFLIEKCEAYFINGKGFKRHKDMGNEKLKKI